MRILFTALMLLAAVSGFSATTTTISVEKDTVATQKDSTCDAMTVLMDVSKFLTPMNYGRIQSMQRNPSNTEAWSTIEYTTEKKVLNMVCDGFAWQYKRVTPVHKVEEAGELKETYLHEFNNHKYTIVITRLSTGHDSGFIYVEVKG